jgi:Flp pilus assembly pilin Flp
MLSIKKMVIQFITEEDGATMVEYTLTCCLIAMVAISAMKFLGSSASNKLNAVSGNITNSN